jgi:hypothetical protein
MPIYRLLLLRLLSSNSGMLEFIIKRLGYIQRIVPFLHTCSMFPEKNGALALHLGLSYRKRNNFEATSHLHFSIPPVHSRGTMTTCGTIRFAPRHIRYPFLPNFLQAYHATNSLAQITQKNSRNE